MKNGSLAVYVKITASHHFDDLRLFHLFRIGSAPRFTSCPYGTEHFRMASFFGCSYVGSAPSGSTARAFLCDAQKSKENPRRHRASSAGGVSSYISAVAPTYSDEIKRNHPHGWLLLSIGRNCAVLP